MPKYYLGAAPAEIDMRVPNTVRKCVLFIGIRDLDGTVKYGGTAFVVLVPGSNPSKSFGYIVTAKHVLELIGDRPFVLRASLRDGSSVMLEITASHWTTHPDPSVDAAVTPLLLTEPLDLDVLGIHVDNFLSDEIIAEHGIGAGDQVFITGLFTRAAGTSRNMPIVRMGTIALMPSEKIPHGTGLIDAYLIEHHSIGGLSGSPAFVNETAIIQIPYTEKKRSNEPLAIFAPGQTFFLGLVRGHWELPVNAALGQLEPMNYGISVVVPAHKIRDILYSEEQKCLRTKIEEQELKNDPSVVVDHGFPTESFTREDFETALKKASRKIETQ